VPVNNGLQPDDCIIVAGLMIHGATGNASDKAARRAPMIAGRLSLL